MTKVILVGIRMIISAIAAIIAYRYTLIYNLHMFQLNGYKNKEHINWLKKYKKRQWVLGAALVLGALDIALPGAVTDMITLLWFFLIVVVYQALCGMSQKKPLVYTARVKRLVAAVIALDVILFFAAVAFMAWRSGLFNAISVSSGAFGRLLLYDTFYNGYFTVARIDGLLLIIVGFKFISCVIANIVNKPIESGVNRHFINDAKRKLKSYGPPVIIGVTGSYGKTSVKYYLGELLKVKYNVCITPESYNTPMGVVRTIREHMKPGTEVFVCEMGARHVGDIKELCDLVHPDHGIITSIGPQHLETFFTMDNIINTKYELADALPKEGMLFLNGDNEFVCGNSGKYANAIMYHGAGSGPDDKPDAGRKGYHAENVTLSPQGTFFDVITPQGERESFRMSLIGSHNLENVVGAITVAHSMGIALKDLKIPVRRLKSVPHRLELKRQGGLNIIDDAYNSNPAGSKAALDTLAMFDGTKIMITPGMVELGDKEEQYNYEFGAHAAEVCDHLLLVGRDRVEPIRRGALDKGKNCDIRVFAHFEEAFSYAVQLQCDTQKYILIENDLPDNY